MREGAGIAGSGAASVASYLDRMGYLRIRPRLAARMAGGMAEAYLSSPVAVLQVPQPYMDAPCRRQYYMTPVRIAHRDGRLRVAGQLGVELLRAHGICDAAEAIQVAADIMALCCLRNPSLSVNAPTTGCALVKALGYSLAAWRALLAQDLDVMALRHGAGPVLPWLSAAYRDMYATPIMGRAEVRRAAHRAQLAAAWPSAPVLRFLARLTGGMVQGRVLVDASQDAGMLRHGCLVLRAYCGQYAEPVVQGGSYAPCERRRNMSAIGLSMSMDRITSHPIPPY
ncbi:ATP phosphoribosyltransferase regulatory subunit [Candidatus Tremblaya princeps]|uniref:ATP phosphoribosyltransferase regulatory subunit n=1 Tax=Tremblaya princeps TaxID=189385 RepID=A0A143WNM5_TREPR|nr:ATP phosphoribosyltransferase regulatory subunit [Candidatus Tremblaya princeps]